MKFTLHSLILPNFYGKSSILVIAKLPMSPLSSDLDTSSEYVFQGLRKNVVPIHGGYLDVKSPDCMVSSHLSSLDLSHSHTLPLNIKENH